MIERLCIVGVGLIGGSLARAVRAAGYCKEVIGTSRQADNLRRAVELGVIDGFETDVAKAVVGADMIVVCVPMTAMGSVFAAMKGHLEPNAVLTDAGSAKASVIESAREAFGDVPPFLVPGHPIAGTEHSGVEASFATLYQGHRVILTPCKETDPAAVERVREMWAVAGANIDILEPAYHDEVLAATSHIPHLLAYSLVDLLGQMEERREIFKFAAGGFRDSTRIASSDPAMWRDICLVNSEAIVSTLERYIGELSALTGAIRAGEGDQLFEKFARAKAIRDRYVVPEANSDEPDPPA
ncbi:MAG: prephenate dehydrogenase/arogenate dehydrogenase family protein [Gammaproteobacteria bacterium]|nr:prephenate dehydrogenase/arogenate dehydrogenase family protein [Gammaproteobacteria bacterium]